MYYICWFVASMIRTEDQTPCGAFTYFAEREDAIAYLLRWNAPVMGKRVTLIYEGKNNRDCLGKRFKEVDDSFAGVDWL